MKQLEWQKPRYYVLWNDEIHVLPFILGFDTMAQAEFQAKWLEGSRIIKKYIARGE